MAKSRAEPATREPPEPSATYWPEAPAFPGGAWFVRQDSSRRIAARSSRAGCGGNGLPFGTALSRAKWTQESQ